MLNDKSLEIGIVVKIDNSIPFGFCRSAKLQHLVTNQLPSFIVQRIGLISHWSATAGRRSTRWWQESRNWRKKNSPTEWRGRQSVDPFLGSRLKIG